MSTRLALYSVSAVVLVGTAYSVVYGTYLDTSNPLLTHLPHPLGQTHYWASKANPLNVYFIKKAWGWTSAAFLLAWATGPPSTRSARIILASGGECVLALPSGGPISVPAEYCRMHTSVSPATHPAFFASSSSFVLPQEWPGATPRLRKGHDVSGHIFLLTLSVLLLAQQLGPSFSHTQWSPPHAAAVWANIALIAIWLFASGTTSVYFHSPAEKITGYLLGLACFVVAQIPGDLISAATTPTPTPREKLHSS
ncbi:hypothetical protein B0H14DRAFT_3852031 [Mycena olivaceomarginata]|nr:hypothetical protein B0H14DRAFT_3852031 [Mycena olivaceomarginata]